MQTYINICICIYIYIFGSHMHPSCIHIHPSASRCNHMQPVVPKNARNQTSHDAANVKNTNIVQLCFHNWVKCILFVRIRWCTTGRLKPVFLIRRALAQGVSDHMFFVFIATFVMSAIFVLHVLYFVATFCVSV